MAEEMVMRSSGEEHGQQSESRFFLMRHATDNAIDLIARDLKPGGEYDLEKLPAQIESTFRHASGHCNDAKDELFDTTLVSDLEQCKATCDAKFRQGHWKDVSRLWRRVYTDSLILKSCLRLKKLITAMIRNQNASITPAMDLGKRSSETPSSALTVALPSEELDDIIKDLDMTIIVAGAPGRHRQRSVRELISAAQLLYHQKRSSSPSSDLEPAKKKLRSTITTQSEHQAASRHKPRARRRIPELDEAPSMMTFTSQLCTKGPFVLRRYADDWPACQPEGRAKAEGRWADGAYLVRAAGGDGRAVPVEVGDQYDALDWGQEIMPWKKFLDRSGWAVQDEKTAHEQRNPDRLPRLYLAQHSLFDQFPTLENDIIMPDYVYSCPPAPSHLPSYQPPRRTIESSSDSDTSQSQDNAENKADGITKDSPQYEEDVIKSVWIGPAGVTSPAHTDPYYNCFVQVVGKKLVWLAPPNANVGNAMYCHGRRTPSPPALDGESSSKGINAFEKASSPTEVSCKAQQPSTHADAETDIDMTEYLTNTSRVDIFGPEPTVIDEFPRFTDEVQPTAAWTILEPGDLLFMPPGWWHGMRTLTRSFSVSFWF